MLNRRHLRIKALQALYSYLLHDKFLRHSATEQISKKFSLDLKDPNPPDTSWLKKRKNMAIELFLHKMDGTILVSEITDNSVIEAVDEAISYYHKSLDYERFRIGNHMTAEANRIQHSYYGVLSLLPVLAQEAFEEAERARNLKRPLPENTTKLMHNPVVLLLKNSEELTQNPKENHSWSQNASFVHKLYREALKPDEEYVRYLNLENTNPEDEEKIIKHIVKNVIFGYEAAYDYFEDHDLYWDTNRHIILDLVNATLKTIRKNGFEKLELLSLSATWDEDSDFFATLFEKTIDLLPKVLALISKKLVNWDIDRIATLDRIVLAMAVTEMITFPGIPVKVTLNEYIELTKAFSSAKSKDYVNGVLNALAEDLMATGEIMKSGKGLIDNV